MSSTFRTIGRRLVAAAIEEQDWMQRFHSIARQYGITTLLPRDALDLAHLVGFPDAEIRPGLGYAKLERYVKAWAAHTAAAREPKGEAAPAPTDPGDEARLSSKSLALIFNLPHEPLRKRLSRWRKKNHTGWVEDPDATSRDAKYLFRFGSIRHIIDDLKTSGERPAK
jgi:hypothetical protein